MILTDAGPLIALMDRGERNHARCVDALEQITLPMVTCWPAFTEAMYLLGAAGGWPGQTALWTLVERGNLEIAVLPTPLLARMRALMEQYRDLPMDFADASLVAYAEEHHTDRIFTLDSDFSIYRLPRGRSFTIVP
jgi:hypothetical protein